jgi:hypothetical protein
MKSARNYLLVLLALTTLAGSVLAWVEYQQLAKLRAELLDPTERTDLQKRLADAQKRVRDLEDQLVALRGRGGPERSDEADGRPDDQNRWAGRRGGFMAMMNDPKIQKLMAIQQKGQLDARFASLFKSLNLTPQQLDQFKDLLVQKQQALMDAVAAAREQGISPRSDPVAFNQAISDAQAAVDAQIQSALGDAGFAQYQQYVQTLPDRNTVSQLQQALSYTGTPLTDDQANQMIQLLANTATQRGGNGTAGTAAGAMGALFGGGNQSAPISDETIAQSSGILSGPQLQALQQLQVQQQTQRQIQQAMRQAAAPPPPPPGG